MFHSEKSTMTAETFVFLELEISAGDFGGQLGRTTSKRVKNALLPLAVNSSGISLLLKLPKDKMYHYFYVGGPIQSDGTQGLAGHTQ